MINPKIKKKNRNAKIKPKRKVNIKPTRTWIKKILGFIIFTILSLHVIQLYIPLNSKPQMKLRVNMANVYNKIQGCEFYSFFLSNDSPIEYAYVKVSMPKTIIDQNVAIADFENFKYALGMTLPSGAKTEKGECYISPAPIIDNCIVVRDYSKDSFTSYSNGNVFTLKVYKLPRKSVIIGMIATNDTSIQVLKHSEVTAEGEYEYLKLGQIVRKPIQISLFPYNPFTKLMKRY